MTSYAGSKVFSNKQKTSWADEVDELNSDPSNQHKVEDSVDGNGIRKTVQYNVNEQGQMVKITRRTIQTLQKPVVNHAVADRQKWTKFGQELGNERGPDMATTSVGENVSLNLRAGNKSVESTSQDNKSVFQRATAKVTCRHCKGDHFTARCPYKDALLPAENGTASDEDFGTGPDIASPSAASRASAPTGGKYVPPSMRGPGGARVPGEAIREKRDDLPTLRVTNISEDTQESDLRELFGIFGRVVRVYVGRGFAFVSFEDRNVAQRALDKVNGRGYDNLILSVQWSQPRKV